MASTQQSLLLVAAGLLLGWGTSSWVRWARHQMLQWLFPLGPLNLDRPLVAFDVESTGLNVSRDRMLEIAAVKVWPGGKVEVKGPQRLNPKVNIPAEVTAIHHITQADLVGCPSFAQVAQEWRDFLEGCDLAGYNAKKFDVPILRNEFRRAGHFNFPPLGVPVVDAFRIFCQQEPRTLSAAVSFYCGRLHLASDAHSALGDAWATLKVLVEQVRRYGDLPRSVSALAELCGRPGRAQDITPDSKFQWRGDQPVVAFGKYSGEPLAVLIARHRDHLMWMSGQDWGDESLLLVGQALKGLLPTREGAWEPLFDTPPPDPAAAAAAAAAAVSSGVGSREQPAPLEQNGDPQMQPAAAQDQQQQQGDAAASDSSKPAAHNSSSTSNHTTTNHNSSSRNGSMCAPPTAQPPPEAMGWPDLTSSSSSTVPPHQGVDSWGVQPSSSGADGWGIPPSSSGVDGWSMLETVGDEGNPGPQAPAEEPEEGGERGEGGGEAEGWQQQQEEGEEGGFEAQGWQQQEEGEEGGWEGDEQRQQQQKGQEGEEGWEGDEQLQQHAENEVGGWQQQSGGWQQQSDGWQQQGAGGDAEAGEQQQQPEV